ncbi:MAG: glycosyl transferase family 39, partial [Deltaproteobacteria bacterium]
MGGSDERKYEEAFWALALLLLAFHLVYIGITPYDLAPDEAYYWLWSKRLSWGYYSKPPLVAWLIRLSTSLGGDTPFFVRLGAPIFSFISSLALFYFAKGLFGPRVGFWAFLLSNLTAASPVGAMIMTIDAPLIAFWGLTLLFLLPALRGKGAFWYLSGICLGLGLLSKYAAGALVPSLFFYLATSKRDRSWLSRKEPYIWVGLGFLLLLPNLIW